MSKPDLISPWHPMKDAVDVKHLGKLGVTGCIPEGYGAPDPERYRR